MIGTVRRVVEEKGFGFIRGLTNDKEYFFHREDCVGHETFFDLIYIYNKGIDPKVEFTEDETPKGARARNVMKVEE